MNSTKYVYVLSWSGYEGNDATYLLHDKKFTVRQYQKIIQEAYIRAFEGIPKSYGGLREMFNLFQANFDLNRGFRDENFKVDGEMKDYFDPVIDELQKDGFSRVQIHGNVCVSEMSHIIDNENTRDTGAITRTIKKKYPQLNNWLKLPVVEIHDNDHRKYDFFVSIENNRELEKEMLTKCLGRTTHENEYFSFYFVELEEKRYAKFDRFIKIRHSEKRSKTYYKEIPESSAREMAVKILDWDKNRGSINLA